MDDTATQSTDQDLRPFFYDIAQLPGYTIEEMAGDGEGAQEMYDLFGRELVTKTILMSPKLSVFHESAKPGERVKPHRHGTHQLTYVLRGELIYGNQHTIRAVIQVIEAYRAAHPNAPRVVIGDISRNGGGPMTDEHVSHQNGLDVDIYYPRVDGELRAPTTSDQIDTVLAQDLVDRFVAAGAQMIFVGFSTRLHGPSGVVIPYANHDYHMHVRFPPPGG